MERNRSKEAGKYCSLYAAPSGCGAVVAGNEGLVEVFLPVPRTPSEMISLIAQLYPHESTENEVTRKAACLLEKYFSGERVLFDVTLDLGECTEFQRSVYSVVRKIPYGVVKTYADIAAEINRPKAYRGIGSAMARNPMPIVIPCHRVIGSDGRLTGYSAPGGVGMKHDLLLMEGIHFDERGGRVRSMEYGS
jgi:methylated-DNA-[protein]-cysteine S-methyltransferase